MLKGKISINKVGHLASQMYMKIALEDELSGVQVFEAKMQLRDFAQAITGLSHVDVKYELGNVELVGKMRMEKTILVKFPVQKHHMMSDEVIRVAISEYEVAGWVGCDADAKNYHNFVHSDKVPQAVKDAHKDISVYRVGYHRYV